MIKSIYEGLIMQIWEDGNIVFIVTPHTALKITKKEWEVFKKDMRRLNEVNHGSIRNH